MINFQKYYLANQFDFLETLLAKFSISSYKGVQNQKLKVGQRISGDALICEMKLK